MREKQYLLYRKTKAFINSLCFYLCRIFAVKKNRIAVCTFEGKGGFGCNPKYVVEELHKRNPSYEFIWLVNDPSKNFPEYIRVVPNTLFSRAYWLSTSKVWIDNYRKPYGTKKRKGQYYLNVNHYTLAIKTVGIWRGAGFSKMAYLVSKHDSNLIDDLVIDSAFCERAFPKGLVYDGNYLKTGAPRCDVLFGEREQKKAAFRIKHHLPEDAKVVMFAPTFREGSVGGKRTVFSEIWTIDFERLLHNLELQFGGNWYLCIRVHPQLADTFNEYRQEHIMHKIIDESQASDMYEILAGMDAYITDYSSACFEAGFAEIPVFLYADDIEQYTIDRGSLFWDFSKSKEQQIACTLEIQKRKKTYLPFTMATNNEELEKNIRSFKETQYHTRLQTFHEEIDLVFDGKASERLADRVEEKMVMR